MSTDLILEKALAESGLVRFIPSLDDDENDYREIWMTTALHDWLYQKDSKRGSQFKYRIRAALKTFVINDSELKIDNDDFMKPLISEYCGDVFEVRYQPYPFHPDATRIFGAFAEQDCLVLLHQKLKSKIQDYDKLIKKTVEMWDDFLPGFHMVKAYPFSNCVSGSFSDVHSS